MNNKEIEQILKKTAETYQTTRSNIDLMTRLEDERDKKIDENNRQYRMGLRKMMSYPKPIG